MAKKPTFKPVSRPKVRKAIPKRGATRERDGGFDDNGGINPRYGKAVTVDELLLEDSLSDVGSSPRGDDP